MRFSSIVSAASLCLLATSALATPRTNSMPGTPTDPKQYRPGTLIAWGNANGADGTAIGFDYSFSFDPNPNLTIVDDGSLSGTVTDDKFISETVTVSFAGGATRATLVGRLTVTDPGDLSSDTDSFVLDIVGTTDPISDTPAEALLVDVNQAINNGLRALYLLQSPNGQWTYYESVPVGVTGYGLWAFENQGHFAKNDPDEDIYAEFLAKSIAWLTGGSGSVVAFDPPVQTSGDPDADGNNRCVELNSDFERGYSTPIATAGLISALDPARPITSGPLSGEVLKDMIQDLADWSSYAQNDPEHGIYRGTWRYTPNFGSGDKSADSWNYVALEGAEFITLCDVQEWVKVEAEYGEVYDQALDGRYGYASTSPIGDGVGHATTGAGLAGLAFLTAGGRVATYPGAPATLDTTAEKRDAAVAYLGSVWGSGGFPSFLSGNRGNGYAMWTITRALRLNSIEMLDNGGLFDWELNITAPDAPTEGYFPFLVRVQNPDGSWDFPDGFYNNHIDTAFALLILSPTVFAQSCQRVAVNFDLDLEANVIPDFTDVDSIYVDASCVMTGVSGDTGFGGVWATDPTLDPTTDDIFPTSLPNCVSTRPSSTRRDSDYGRITFTFVDDGGATPRTVSDVSLVFLDVEDSGYAGGRSNTKMVAYDVNDVEVGRVEVPMGPNGNVFLATIADPGGANLEIAKLVVDLGDRDDSCAIDDLTYCLNPPTVEAAVYGHSPFVRLGEPLVFSLGLQKHDEQSSGEYKLEVRARVTLTNGRIKERMLGTYRRVLAAGKRSSDVITDSRFVKLPHLEQTLRLLDGAKVELVGKTYPTATPLAPTDIARFNALVERP